MIVIMISLYSWDNFFVGGADARVEGLCFEKAGPDSG
jgi:hypothetical protein